MKIFFSFLKPIFLFCFILSAFIVTSTSLALNKAGSFEAALLESQCFAKTLGGGDDLIPWPLPWPVSQCPWSMNNLYGNWVVKGVERQEDILSKGASSKNTSYRRVEKYRIFNSLMGVSIIRHNSDGTYDRGFVIENPPKNRSNYYKAFMHSPSGAVYFLSIYAHLSAQPSFYRAGQSSCLGTKKQQVKDIIFIQHKVHSFFQCEENITSSWLLEKQ